MNDKQRKEYGRTLKVLMEDLPDVRLEMITAACDVFTDAERKLAAINLRHCNGYKGPDGNWSQKAQEKDERTAARWEERAKQAADAIGVGLEFTYLPSSGLRLILPSGRTNVAENWAILWV